jgi:hypothetical protein
MNKENIQTLILLDPFSSVEVIGFRQVTGFKTRFSVFEKYQLLFFPIFSIQFLNKTPQF